MLSLILALAIATAPCDKTDNECLLNQLLQQTYDLEATQAQNQMMQKQIEASSGREPKLFLCGMLVGIVFVSLATTFAMKISK